MNDWQKRVADCLAEGGKLHTPNGLPVMCIRADGLMLECEHGDHADYMFPVTAKLLAEPEKHEGFAVEGDDTHALIYTDGSIALTLYECTYYLWALRTGELLRGPRYDMGKRKLSVEDVAKILSAVGAEG